MLQKTDIEKAVQRIKPDLENRFYLEQIGLFGSYVRNEANENSAIDFLVSFKKSIGLELVDLKNYLKDALGKDVNIATESGLKEELKESILKEVVYL